MRRLGFGDGPFIPGGPFGLPGGLGAGQAPSSGQKFVNPGNEGGEAVFGSVMPVLSRVPANADMRRLTRLTDVLVEIINSLAGQGILVKTAENPPTWTIKPPP